MQHVAISYGTVGDMYLCANDGDDGLRMDQTSVAEIVKATGGEDLAASLPPDSLSEGYALVLGQDLGGEASKCSHHGPSAVDHFDFAVAAEGLRVCGETCCVLQIPKTHSVHKLPVEHPRMLRDLHQNLKSQKWI